MTNLPLAFAELMAGGLLFSAGYKGATPGQVIRGETGAAASFAGGNASSGSTTSAATTSGPATSAGGVSGNAAGILHYLTRNGLTPIAAAGVVGNLQQESSLNPSSVQAGGPGRGIAQWSQGGRWDTLVAWAQGKGLAPTSLNAQLQFLIHEAQTSYPGLIAQLNQASSPAEAAQVFETTYERAGSPDMPNRIAYANSAYQAAGY